MIQQLFMESNLQLNQVESNQLELSRFSPNGEFHPQSAIWPRFSPVVRTMAPLSAYSILYEVSCFCTDIIRNDSRLVICLAFSLLAASLVAAHSIPLIFVWFRIPPNPNYSWCLNPMLQDFEQPRSTTNQIGPRPSSH